VTLPGDVPVDPLPPEAKQWLIDELSKPQYQAAKPTLFDQISKAIADWFASLQFGDAQGPPVFGNAVIIVLVVAGLVVAFLIYGIPRLNRRSSVVGELFGENDDRSAADMRADAAAAASRGDYATATAELFRAIARGLAERSIVTVTPGTTAHGFAVRAAATFPNFGARLGDAATAFDEVRYLEHPGSVDAYESLVALESDLRSARPRLDSVPA
jgi:hypothetical protein